MRDGLLAEIKNLDSGVRKHRSVSHIQGPKYLDYIIEIFCACPYARVDFLSLLKYKGRE
jgi:hypothetical protein